ncbi:MAG: ATP-binding protein [Candidatus Omnitrophota bacterium]
MIKPNPFTPQSGWEPKVFGGRERQLADFDKTLEEAVSLRSNHVVVLGEWGVGKTSLLKQYKKISQSRGYPASYCSICRFDSRSRPSDGINLIMQEIAFGFPSAKFTEEADLSRQKPPQKIKGGKKKLEPQVLFAEFLLNLFKTMETKLAVVLLDDVQNLLCISEVIDILRSVLSKEEILSRARYLFVLAGTPAGWDGFVDKHDPVGRFFRRRENISLLTERQAQEIILDSLEKTGVVFEQEVMEKIFFYTLGHPYELQLLCSHLYDAQIEGKVTSREWESAFATTLRELGRDYFDSLYRRASDREGDILEILAEKNIPLKIADLRAIMITEKRAKNFPVANIKNFLYRLKDKELVKRGEDNSYSVLDAMFVEYIRRNKKVGV